jgi:hypothetical protein
VLATELRDLLGMMETSTMTTRQASSCQYSSQVKKSPQLTSQTWKPDGRMRQHYLMEAHIAGGQQ